MGILNIPQLNLPQNNSGTGLHLLTTLLSPMIASHYRAKEEEETRAAKQTDLESTRTELEKWLTAQQPSETTEIPAAIARPEASQPAEAAPVMPQQTDLQKMLAPAAAENQEQPSVLSGLLLGNTKQEEEIPISEQTKQVTTTPAPVTLPAKQSPGVYQAAALAGLSKAGIGKEPAMQLIADEEGNQRFVPKVMGETGYQKQQDYVVKAEVKKDADGKERVYNMAYNKHNPGAKPQQMGEVRDPLATSTARAEAFAKAKPFPTLDAYNNFTPAVVSWGEANAANQQARAAGQPDRYVPIGPTTTALEKMALVADMQRTIDRVRETLPGAKFDAAGAAQASEMLRSINDKEAFSRMVQYAMGKTLTPGQADYLIALAQMQENSMALRSVLKAGPGSDQLREKILATLPSGSTPDLAYASKQIDQYESMLGALGKGVTGNVPGRTIRGISSQTPLPMGKAAEAGAAPTTPTTMPPGTRVRRFDRFGNEIR